MGTIPAAIQTGIVQYREYYTSLVCEISIFILGEGDYDQALRTSFLATDRRLHEGRVVAA